jgi:hypothetical protein
MSLHELQAARERRARRGAVASALAQVHGHHDTQALPWTDLALLPDWCLWVDARRARLVRVAGALFAAPGMRLWIDAARLRAARALVGEWMFDRVMHSPELPAQAPGVPGSGDLARLFDNAGRAVLLGSLPAAWMRGVAAPRLPAADAQPPMCPAVVARPLTTLALQLLQQEAEGLDRVVLREPPADTPVEDSK